ncbi:hypothetical protein P8827_21780, partial [Shouchella clausii]|nr:hypothetical protein [Shouchella clausii]
SGTSFEQLTLEEQTKIRRINELVDQFVAADKYIFATPSIKFNFLSNTHVFLEFHIQANQLPPPLDNMPWI